MRLGRVICYRRRLILLSLSQGIAFGRWGGGGYDLIGSHPPCTYLCGSGLHWNNRGRGWEKTEEALEFVRRCMGCGTKYYLENPVGLIGTRIRPADQWVNPYDFGEDASKKTGMWLSGLPKLVIDPSLRKSGRLVNGRERWGNQTDSGQNKLGPSDTRWAERSMTYPSIALAMATQWG